MQSQLDDTRQALAASNKKAKELEAQLAEARRMYASLRGGGGGGGGDLPHSATPTQRYGSAALAPPRTPDHFGLAGGRAGGGGGGGGGSNVSVAALAATSSAAGFFPADSRGGVFASPYAQATGGGSGGGEGARPSSAGGGPAVAGAVARRGPSISGILHASERAMPRDIATPQVLGAGAVMHTAKGVLRVTQGSRV